MNCSFIPFSSHSLAISLFRLNETEQVFEHQKSIWESVRHAIPRHIDASNHRIGFLIVIPRFFTMGLLYWGAQGLFRIQALSAGHKIELKDPVDEMYA